ncbi:ead/Ea22-like family protein [Klebsiella pneumoniae]|uniref:ead/Ea22-like family protein n=2 Tax=Klebsiella TaxID=570 RepID=UPI001CE0A267|nr:ead/Ea22-like family protein [Klebsiella pneumoniae]MCA4952632.1 ead/Ea22-like family protein [Klebsiella pneumoniae]MCA5502068.1 ead/Ea22-like family protein [Klebsiella pneumoniae]MCA5512930.1 ead/Ea22-like family protein [Klebsiella pneumoniae]MCA5528838.1 ead/Ea22-like family protein [Klebsiella pneumoniae]MDK6524897.1 ead/Ea22-like family protein [Klebsiella pneumoniae]
MTERFSMNPISAKLLNEAWRLAFPDEVAVARRMRAMVEALEKAQGMEAYWKTQCRGITDHCEELQARIAELEREQEHLRPVGVMSEKAFHRLENSECRFIALWPRPGIFLPRKRPEDGVIVYARTAASAGIKMEAE